MMTTTTPPALAPLRAIVATLQAARPETATLWTWPLELLLTRRIWPAVHLEGYWLEGEGTGFDYLLVRTGDGYLCGCKAYRRRGGVCAHALAVELWERLQEAPVIAPGRPYGGRTARG
jgi:hypothetical protein